MLRYAYLLIIHLNWDKLMSNFILNTQIVIPQPCLGLLCCFLGGSGGSLGLTGYWTRRTSLGPIQQNHLMYLTTILIMLLLWSFFFCKTKQNKLSLKAIHFSLPYNMSTPSIDCMQ